MLKYTIQATDILGSTYGQIVTITIQGTNDAPVLQPNSGTVFEGGVGGPSMAIGNVLGNDTDIDQNGLPPDDALSVTGLSFDRVPFVGSVNGGGAVIPNSAKLVDGLYGTLQISIDGSFIYTLKSSLPSTRALVEGEVALETFTYTVSDGNGGILTEKIRSHCPRCRRWPDWRVSGNRGITDLGKLPLC